MIPLTMDEIVSAIQGRMGPAVSKRSVSGVSTDSRSCGTGEVFFAIRGPRFDGHAFLSQAFAAGAMAAVVDRTSIDQAERCVFVGDTVAALGKLAAYHRRQRSGTVIAVTGSNGKTTTKNMIHHVLSRHKKGKASPASFNNHIGVPLTLLSSEAGDDYLVVEVGSNAPGEIASLGALADANIGVVTNAGRAHLAGFGGIEGVVAEKLSLLDTIRPGGLAVVDANIPDLAERIGQWDRLNVVTFGCSAGADVRVDEVRCGADGVSCRINGRHELHLTVPGAHNALNAAAAFTVCRRMQLDPNEIVETLRSFKLPKMRLNTTRVGGVMVINDAYNANPDSMAAAIDCLCATRAQRHVAVVGDMLELGTAAEAAHVELGERLASLGVGVVIAVGTFADSVAKGVRECDRRVEVVSVADVDGAASELRSRLREGDCVLIKGSRKLGLDRCAEGLNRSLCGSDAGPIVR